MSVLRKPCPRGQFDCKRCLARMKNTGNVWTIDTLGSGFNSFTNPDLVTGPIHAFPAFVHTLEWDAVPANSYPVPDNAECLSRLAGHSNSGETPTWGDYVVTDGYTNMIATIYYSDGKWGLSFHFVYPSGGVVSGFASIYELVYTSEENRCLIPSSDPGVFTLDSITNDTEHFSPGLYFNIPQQINFYHTKLYD